MRWRIRRRIRRRRWNNPPRISHFLRGMASALQWPARPPTTHTNNSTFFQPMELDIFSESLRPLATGRKWRRRRGGESWSRGIEVQGTGEVRGEPNQPVYGQSTQLLSRIQLWIQPWPQPGPSPGSSLCQLFICLQNKRVGSSGGVLAGPPPDPVLILKSLSSRVLRSARISRSSSSPSSSSPPPPLPPSPPPPGSAW